MKLQRFQRAVVEPDLAVRQVAVVGEDKIGHPLAGKFRDRGYGPFDVQLDGATPLEKSVNQVEQADAQAMWPENWMIRGRGLDQLCRAADYVLALHLGLDRIHTHGL